MHLKGLFSVGFNGMWRLRSSKREKPPRLQLSGFPQPCFLAIGLWNWEFLIGLPAMQRRIDWNLEVLWRQFARQQEVPVRRSKIWVTGWMVWLQGFGCVLGFLNFSKSHWVSNHVDFEVKWGEVVYLENFLLDVGGLDLSFTSLALALFFGLQVLERFYCEIAIMKKLDHPGQCLSKLLEETIFLQLLQLWQQTTYPWKLMVGRWKSFLTASYFSGDMLIFFGGILVLVTTRLWPEKVPI